MDDTSKKLLREYGIFAGLLIVMISILGLSVVLSRRNWEEGLKKDITQVIEKEAPGQWTVGEFMKIKAPAAMSAACFRGRNTKSGARVYLIIARIETLYGPFPAVFAYDEKNGAKLIGIAGLEGRIRRQIGDGTNDSKVQYWMAKMRDIAAAADSDDTKGRKAGK